MMVKWFLMIGVTSMLWTTCLSQNGCTGTILNTSNIVFTCLSNVIINELPLYNYTINQLGSITSIVVNGPNTNTPGPFTSIPPNICLLPNLQSVVFSNNRIQQVDPAGAVGGCLSGVTTLDISYNNISEFPSVMIYNMTILKNLYFQHNQLTNIPLNAFYNVFNLEIIDFSYNFLTNFELWSLVVKTSADFSYNRISTITNNYFFDISPHKRTNTQVYLTGNSPTVNLTDAVYEMYNSCPEVNLWLTSSLGNLSEPELTFALTFIHFGTTRINCNCDQSYIVQMIASIRGGQDFNATSAIPIYNASCTDNTRLVDSNCDAGISPPNSSVDFSRVYPRQCKIFSNEPGVLTTSPIISPPIRNMSTYPHYETRLMNPGACFFTFTNTTAVQIECTIEVSNSSTIPSDLYSSSYFTNIVRIEYIPPISSLPSYLCSLPSHNIDLSFQAFTLLNDQTFPCLNWFTTVKLAYNQLTSVNMSSGNFTNLNSLDLSSNRLTRIPYTLLNPTPSSLRYLDLRNNSITSIDLFLYTLQNITVDLRNNPIVNSTIINPNNIVFPSGSNTTLTVAITYPLSVTNSTYLFNDQTALTAGTCNRNAVLAYLSALQSAFDNVLLDCTCASINLKEIFLRSGSNITNYFTCSDPTTVASYSTLTMASCTSTALNFSMGLCYNESLQTFLDNTTIEFLNTNVHLTSTSLITNIINLSISSIVIQNQQSTSSSEFERSDFDLYTIETLTSKDISYSEVTSASSIDTSTTLSTTASMADILLINDTTAIIADSGMTISAGWTTTTTTTTTSTSSTSVTTTTTSTTTSTSTSTTTTSATTSTTSSSVSTSSSTSTSTSTSTTTRTTTTTSTSTSTSTTTTTSTSTSTSTTTTSATTSSTSTSVSTLSSTSTSTSTSTTTTSATTSTTTTSATTTTSTSTSTSSTTTSATTRTTSTSATTTTSTSTSTSSTTTSATSSTTTSSTTSFTTATSANASSDIVGAAGDINDSRTGLIIGLVLGLLGFLILLAALIIAIILIKSRGRRNAAGTNKPVGRAAVVSQAPQHALLQSRVPTRTPRLAPLTTQTSQLPPPVFSSNAPSRTTANPPSAKLNESDIRSPVKGIPVRLGSIRSPSNVVPQYGPNSSTSNNPSSFRPINNSTGSQPRIHQKLNVGGDNRY